MKVALDILRKNVLSFVCLIIAILAVAAVWVWPLPAKFTELQAKVNDRKREYEALDSLLKKERHLPIVDPTETTGKVLEQYPTPTAIKRAEDVAANLASEGKKVLELAAKYNQHKLLVPGSLPNATPTLTVQFQEAYQREMDYPNPDKSVRQATMPYRLLKAGIPPTEQDIQTEAARLEQEITQEKNIPGAQDAMNFDIAQMKANLPAKMRDDVAKNSLMYMNPDAVDVFPGIMVGGAAATNTQPTAAQIYFAQVGIWVQQDVFDALAKANEGSTGVVDSPVKHLLKIEVIEDYGKTGASGGAGAPFGQPAFGSNSATGGLPILANTNAALGGAAAFVTPGAADAAAVAPRGPTARTSGPIYDVVPFRLIINVDATQIPKVLTELSRGKFITVTKCDVLSREATSEMLQGYYYGPVPVVQLTLDCEMLLLKNWLQPLVPAGVGAAGATTGAPM